MKPHIRWMIRRDMPDVLRIEGESFVEPWSEDDFIRALRQRNVIGMVAVDSESENAIGHMVYELHRTRLHLLNIAVGMDHRRRGVGRAMLEKLVGKLNASRRSKLVLECADWNLPAHKFFRSCGLRATKVLHEFYTSDDADAYVFSLDINQQAEAMA